MNVLNVVNATVFVYGSYRTLWILEIGQGVYEKLVLY